MAVQGVSASGLPRSLLTRLHALTPAASALDVIFFVREIMETNTRLRPNVLERLHTIFYQVRTGRLPAPRAHAPQRVAPAPSRLTPACSALASEPLVLGLGQARHTSDRNNNGSAWIRGLTPPLPALPPDPFLPGGVVRAVDHGRVLRHHVGDHGGAGHAAGRAGARALPGGRRW